MLHLYIGPSRVSCPCIAAVRATGSFPCASSPQRGVWDASCGGYDPAAQSALAEQSAIFLKWKVLSLLSCLAYIVCVSVQYNSVLMTQALLTVVFVFYVSLGFIQTLLMKGAICVAPFQILFSNYVCKARLSVMMEP